TFLHDTRDFWPDPDNLPPEPRSNADAFAVSLRAIVARAALLGFIGQKDRSIRELEVALGHVTGGNRLSLQAIVLHIRIITDAVAAIAVASPAELFRWTEELLPRLTGISRTFTTAAWYSRTHIEVVEGLVLAFPAVRGV